MPHLHQHLKRIADVARFDLEAIWDIAHTAPAAAIIDIRIFH